MLEHRPNPETTAARGYQDPRSYVSFAGHEYLFGEDVGPRRHAVYERDEGLCQRCGLPAPEFGPDMIHGEMHHVKGGNGPQRNHDMTNLEWLCFPCHWAEKNGAPKSTKRKGRYGKEGQAA